MTTSAIVKAGATGAMKPAIAVVAGAAAGFGLAYLEDKSEFLRKNWWSSPALLAALAYVARNKYPAAALAVAGVAGYGFAAKYPRETKGLDGYSPAAASIEDGLARMDALARSVNDAAARMATLAASDDVGAIMYGDTAALID